MARFTLSIADDVAAQLDAYAAENNLNRSQAAEHLFRQAFAPAEPVASVSVTASVQPAAEEPRTSANSTVIDVEYLTDRLLEVQDYLTRVYSANRSLHNYVIANVDPEGSSFGVSPPRQLPEPPWVR